MKFKEVFYIFFLSLLVGCTSATPTMPSMPEATSPLAVMQTATQTPLPTATLSPEQQITAMVNKSKETGIFPSGLTEEQERAWFEELNRQSGHIFTFEIPGDPSNIIVNVPPDLYPNFGEEVKVAKRWEEPKEPSFQRTYGDWSNTWIVPKDFFNTEEGKKIAEQLKRDVWIQIIRLKDKSGQPTEQLAFFDQATNQYIPIIDSEKINNEFWQTQINKKNVGDFFQPSELAYRTIMQGENIAVPVVLATIPQAGNDRFLAPNTQGSVNDGSDVISTIAILEFENEQGEPVLIGKSTQFMIGHNLYATFLKQGDSELKYEARFSFAFRNEWYLSLKDQPIIPAGIYFAIVSTNPQKTYSGIKGGRGVSWLIEGPYCQPILSDSTPSLKATEYSCGVTDLAAGPVLVKKTK